MFVCGYAYVVCLFVCCTYMYVCSVSLIRGVQLCTCMPRCGRDMWNIGLCHSGDTLSNEYREPLGACVC